jgi:Protein of unknown function (DUF3231)
MGILSGNPQNEPMHYGEVYGIYTQLSVAKAALDGYQVYCNHTGDKDLKEFIKGVINSSIKPSIKELEQLLVANDVVVPPTPAERPDVDIEQIPVGARFQDAQIAYANCGEDKFPFDLTFKLVTYNKISNRLYFAFQSL